MAKFRILVVDNEAGMLEVCQDILQRLPETDVVTESDAVKAAQLVKEEVWDLLLTDIRMPGMTGIELIREARAHDEGISSLIMTAFPSVDSAVEGMKLGAADYLVKPFKPEDLRLTVRRMLDNKRLREENRLLSRQVERSHWFGEMIGGSAPMRDVFSTIEMVSDTDADVLITGATGTGKELVARSVHRLSNRPSGKFVPVDCGAIPESLMESEFFGHERGAFTGATARSLGLMEFAHEGTLFLDEIGELPLNLQAKLLRALQERRFRRIGAKTEIDVDLRVVAATSRDLEAEVAQGRFRADLFYRINVIRIRIPPLSERADDIPLLVEHFTSKYGEEMNRAGVRVDDAALEILKRYEWPGNVRELQNVIKRVLAVATSEVVTVEGLPPELVDRATQSAPSGASSFFEIREQQISRFERDYFTSLLRVHGGDVTRAAEEAGVPRGTLYRLLAKHDIAPAAYRS